MKKSFLNVIFMLVVATITGFFLLMLGAMVGAIPIPAVQRSITIEPFYQNDLEAIESIETGLNSSEEAELYSEIDQIYADIMDAEAIALDSESISNEADNADISADLKAVEDDQAVSNESDQALNEISQ